MSIKRFAIALVKYGLLAAALVVTAGLSALTTMRVVLRTQEVVVPSLVGKPLPEAGALAARRRLVLRVEGRRNDPKLGRDLIVEQEPRGGRGNQAAAQHPGVGQPGPAAPDDPGGGG